MYKGTYDIIIVGGGHAGCEAAAIAAKMKKKVLLITMNMQTIAQMSCNPAMGGIAKGQIVREVDALEASPALSQTKQWYSSKCSINQKDRLCGAQGAKVIECALRKCGEWNSKN